MFYRCYTPQPIMTCYRFFQDHYNTPCILSFWQLPEDCLLRGMKLRVANKCFWPSSSLRIYIYIYISIYLYIMINGSKISVHRWTEILLPLIIIVIAPLRVERSLNLFYPSSRNLYIYIYIPLRAITVFQISSEVVQCWVSLNLLYIYIYIY